MTAMRLSASFSVFPNFRRRLCIQRPVSCTTVSGHPSIVQSLCGSAHGCWRYQPRSQRLKVSARAADGDWDATSLPCRSCGDADSLGTSGRKAGESVHWEVFGRDGWTQGWDVGSILDGLQDWNADFSGSRRSYGSQTWNSRKTSRSTPISAFPLRMRLEMSWIEQGDGCRDGMKLPIDSAYEGYSCSSSTLYSISQNRPDCSNSSSSCFSLLKGGSHSGADSWGMTCLPLVTSQPLARFCSKSGRSWSILENFFKYKANFFQITRRRGPARYMYSVGLPLFDKFPASSCPTTEDGAGCQNFQSASSHLAPPTSDHPSCASPEISKGLAAPGLLSLGSQKVLIWGEGDIEHPTDSENGQQTGLTELRSDSKNLEFLGLDRTAQHEVDDQPGVLKITKHTENSSPGATQFVSGEEAPDVESQMEAAVMKALERSLGSPLGREPQIPPPKPLVIVISGPSGVGKDVVIKKLQEQRNGIHFVVTATTRPQRPGEVDGHDYFFVSKEEFQSMIDKGELLEHASVYGDFKGIPKQQVRDCMAKGTDVVLRVDVQGAATVRSILGSNAVFIFLLAESEASLVKRLVTRKTEALDKIVLRIATAREELKRLDEFDYAVVNADGQLDRTVSSICSIIDAEKSRVQQRTATI